MAPPQIYNSDRARETPCRLRLRCLRKEVEFNAAPEPIFEAQTKETALADAGVDVWSESAEARGWELGVMATRAIVVYLACCRL
jgi:hypothetical protein